MQILETMLSLSLSLFLEGGKNRRDRASVDTHHVNGAYGLWLWLAAEFFNTQQHLKVVLPTQNDTSYFGPITGRVAQRISRGRFVLDGKVYHLQRNDGRNTIHGTARPPTPRARGLLCSNRP